MRREENPAEVIDRTSQAIGRANALARHALVDVRARAAHLRELRNYGLHPVGDAQDELEEACTEAGAAVLFLAARSYFLTLDRARLALVRASTEQGMQSAPGG
ncbi:MAG: hypothetical protein HIU86_08365 [Acidobacteria bacterium]|nr:hypothetical protein [Acidobacteriota bacterium]